MKSQLKLLRENIPRAKPSSLTDHSNDAENIGNGAKQKNKPTISKSNTFFKFTQNTNVLKDKNGREVQTGKVTDKTDKPLLSSQESFISSQPFTISASQGSNSSENSEVSFVSPLRQSVSQKNSNKDEKTVAIEYDDVDTENLNDITQVALYAFDIFEYYKQREVMFKIPSYMNKQPSLSSVMRAILVDWLVEVQENFELNHETLYLAVKLVDIYLSKKKVSKELLQLLGACAIFIACKFDERCPPLVEDFLYICDNAYKRREFLRMEMNMLKTVGFDLGIPLSYRFLRRYAKCHRASVELLTLSRYILELSLLEYSLITVRDSLVAAASLYLALRMKNDQWTATLVHYTGYKQEDLITTAKDLNRLLQKAHTSQQTTIFTKYSHEVFHQVAQTKLISDEDICA